MEENSDTSNPCESQSTTPTAPEIVPVSVPETPVAPDIVVAPDFDYVEMGENPAGSIEIEFEIKTGLE